MNLLKYSLLLIAICLLSSCKISETYYSKSVKDWQQIPQPAPEKLKYQVFLIGDAGDAKPNGKDPVLMLLQSKLEAAGSNSAIVYLGDNIYHAGLPDIGDAERKHAEGKINAQLDILKNFKGKTFFIPGNHDWGYSLHEAHSARVQREDAYVEKYLGRKGVFVPENGCPGPVTINLHNDITLIAIDPDWLIENAYRLGTTCDIANEEGFKKQLDTVIAANKGKNIIIAAHQPLFSTGPHSGYVGWKPHIFPLTDFNKYLYLPLPVLGSFYALARASGFSHQDEHNKYYRRYINTILSAVKGTPNVVMAAGHEHTLEYFEHDKKLHEVLSGAGSKKSNIQKTARLGFGAHEKGFAVIKYYDNGEAWVEYWCRDKETDQGRLLFTTTMYVK